jgi:hypothetical protein
MHAVQWTAAKSPPLTRILGRGQRLRGAGTSGLPAPLRHYFYLDGAR